MISTSVAQCRFLRHLARANLFRFGKAYQLAREKLDEVQRTRWVSEDSTRNQRLRRGLLGFWDRLTGKRRLIEKQNQEDIQRGLRRDRREKEELIEIQLRDSTLLAIKIR